MVKHFRPEIKLPVPVEFLIKSGKTLPIHWDLARFLRAFNKPGLIQM